MGAACGKAKTSEEPKARKATPEVVDASDPAVAASAAQPEAEQEPAKPVKEFVTGEGDGVYLMLISENNNISIVQQYAHSKPFVGEKDCICLQIKPPVYVEIKETRFVLQNGKRTLKMGIMTALETPEGQKRVCEAVMECLRLTTAYSAYIHCYPQMMKAPFSVFLVVSEKHSPGTVKEWRDGIKVVGASEELQQDLKEGEATGKEPEPAVKSASTDVETTPEGKGNADAVNGKDEGADKEKAEPEKEKTDADRPSIFMDNPLQVSVEVPQPKTLEQVNVLRPLAEGRSPNFSSMLYIIVVPLPKEKADEKLVDGRVIGEGEVETLQKEVDALNGIMLSTATEQVA